MKTDRKQKREDRKAKILEKYDTDKDGKLSADEKNVLKTAIYAKKPAQWTPSTMES